MNKILIIDDNKYIRYVLTTLFEEYGYIVESAGDKVSAMKEIELYKPGLIVLDKKLPDCDGLDLLVEIKKIDEKLPVIMLTAYAEANNAEMAIRAGAYAFLTKPFDNTEILLTISNALKEAS